MHKTKLLLLLSILSVLLSAPCLANDPYQKMARDLSRGITKLKNPRVAVLALPYHNGVENNGSAIVAERMLTQLANIHGFRVIERNLLKKLLEENELSETGVMDSDSAKHIGKILGVDVIVSGTLIDLAQERTEVNARAINAQSGMILAACQSTIPKTWPDTSRIQRKSSPSQETHEETEVDNRPIEIGYPAAGRSGGPAPRPR